MCTDYKMGALYTHTTVSEVFTIILPSCRLTSVNQKLNAGRAHQIFNQPIELYSKCHYCYMQPRDRGQTSYLSKKFNLIANKLHKLNQIYHPDQSWKPVHISSAYRFNAHCVKAMGQAQHTGQVPVHVSTEYTQTTRHWATKAKGQQCQPLIY